MDPLNKVKMTETENSINSSKKKSEDLSSPETNKLSQRTQVERLADAPSLHGRVQPNASIPKIGVEKSLKSQGYIIVEETRDFFEKEIATFDKLNLPQSADEIKAKDFYQREGTLLTEIGYQPLGGEGEGQYSGTCNFNSLMIQSLKYSPQTLNKIFIGEDQTHVYMRPIGFSEKEVKLIEELYAVYQKYEESYKSFTEKTDNGILPKFLVRRMGQIELLKNRVYKIEKKLVGGDDKKGLNECLRSALGAIENPDSTLFIYLKREGMSDPSKVEIKIEKGQLILKSPKENVSFIVKSEYFLSFSTGQAPYVHMLARLSHAIEKDFRVNNLRGPIFNEGERKSDPLVVAIMGNNHFVPFMEYAPTDFFSSGIQSTLLGEEGWVSIPKEGIRDPNNWIGSHFVIGVPGHAISVHREESGLTIYDSRYKKEFFREGNLENNIDKLLTYEERGAAIGVSRMLSSSEIDKLDKNIIGKFKEGFSAYQKGEK